MRVLSFIFGVTAFGHGLAAAAAQAQDCKPLTLINALQLEAISNGNAMLVPVTINGLPKKFLLDTAGFATQLSWRAVKELNLSAQHRGPIIQSASGAMSDSVVSVDELVLGRQSGKNMKFMVNPDSGLGIGPEPFDGLLSSDLLFKYDFDVDFGSRKLNFFSSDHCPGKIVYWNAQGVGVVPVDFKDGWMTTEVVIDGKTVKAVIDTGATNTVMKWNDALRVFNLKREPAGDEESVSFGDKMVGYIHGFSSLSFGDVTVRNPKVIVTRFKNPMNEDVDTGYNRVMREPMIIIGMNVLKHLHMYVAVQEKKLYVSAASSVAKATPPIGAEPRP
jgi:predicted aspartyl protease